MVLDFGCGVGRLTRAFAEHFELVIGLDISDRMITLANQLNSAFSGCQFLVSEAQDLRRFPDRHFDIVYAGLVLQHIPNREVILSLICEFVRVLNRNGLLVFELPSHIPMRNRIQPRRRLYALFRKLGISQDTLYRRLNLHPLCARLAVPQ